MYSHNIIFTVECSVIVISCGLLFDRYHSIDGQTHPRSCPTHQRFPDSFFNYIKKCLNIIFKMRVLKHTIYFVFHT